MKEIILKNKIIVKSIVKKFLGKPNEDLEQEIYIRTYKNLDKYTEQNKFSKWIATIAANVCRDYLKSASFKGDNLLDDSENALDNIKSSKTPEMVYSQKERQKIVLKAVDALSKKTKEAIVLFEFEDYSYEEISAKLNVPIGTVKSRINSARKILAEKLNFLIEDIENE